MKKRKIIMVLIAILLVILLITLFITLFDFENEPNDTDNLPKVTEELINELYSYIPKNEMGLQTMYTGFYNQIANLSNDIIQSMIYEYIKNYDEFKLETTSLEEMYASGVLDSTSNTNDITPLYKISLNEFNAIFPKIFGKNAEYRNENFRYNYNTLLRLDSNNEYYYVYNNTPLTSNLNDVVFRDITQYAVTNNNETIIIYDYYLRCDLNTNICYDDERKREVSNVTYTEDFDINNYLDELATYKHTYRYEDGYYYWSSSEKE